MRTRLITVQERGKNRVIIWNYSLNPTQSSTTDREREKGRECRGSRSSIPFEPTEPNLEPRIGQPVYRRCCSPSCSRVQNVNEEVIISRWEKWPDERERERTIETNQVRLNETVEERFTCAFSRVHAFTPAYIRIYIYICVYICEYSRCTKEKQKGGWRKGAPTPCVEPCGRGNEMADGGRNTTSRCENRGS